MYFIVIMAVIFLGLLSRQFSFVPQIIGDILYAVMVFFAIRFLFIRSKLSFAALWTLIFCFVIEFAQLYQAEWIVNVRQTVLGHYILGQGFRWDDLLAHVIGICVAFSADSLFIRKN